MLRLPRFSHHTPETLDEALRLLVNFEERGEEVRVIAGGTDLIPNMKHELVTPRHVVSLHALGLTGIQRHGSVLRIGAMTSVQGVADDRVVREHLPALSEACGQIAGPQLRQMGTLGGNICLDTRCLFINQSYFWRQALGFCLKKDGSVCHVVAGGRKCVAAASNDSILPLMLYGAEIELQSTRGARTLPLDDFYVADGVKNTVVSASEILTEVRVPIPVGRVACAYEKLRFRKSIDFSLANVAVLCELKDDDSILRLDLVVSSLGARPKRITLDRQMAGKPLGDDTIEKTARKAHAACRPLTNIAADVEWRREMIPLLVRRALDRVRSELLGPASAVA